MWRYYGMPDETIKIHKYGIVLQHETFGSAKQIQITPYKISIEKRE